MIRVAVADDAFLVREAMQAVLAVTEGVELVAQWADGDAVRAEIDGIRPDLVVTDLRMPPGGDGEGLRIAHELRAHMPGVGVLVLSQYADPRVAVDLLQDGADGRGYLIKDRVTDAQALAAAIHVVAGGGTMIDPGMVGGLLGATDRRPDSALAELTPRELEVLGLMAEGLSNGAIAERLVVTKGAVEKAVGSIFGKLRLPGEDQVSRRVAAVLLYLSD